MLGRSISTASAPGVCATASRARSVSASVLTTGGSRSRNSTSTVAPCASPMAVATRVTESRSVRSVLEVGRAEGPAELRLGRDDVERVAGLEAADGEHGRPPGVGDAAGEGVELPGDVRRHGDRVDAEVGPGRSGLRRRRGG